MNTLEVSTVLPNQSIFFRLLHEQKNILALKMSVTEAFGPKKLICNFMIKPVYQVLFWLPYVTLNGSYRFTLRALRKM